MKTQKKIVKFHVFLCDFFFFLCQYVHVLFYYYLKFFNDPLKKYLQSYHYGNIQSSNLFLPIIELLGRGMYKV